MAIVTHEQTSDRAPAPQRAPGRQATVSHRPAIQRSLGNDHLQRTADCDQPDRDTGRGAGCGGCGGCALVQAKVNVGPAGDRYEQEADRIADHVAGMAGEVPAATGPRFDVQRLATGDGSGATLDVTPPESGGRELSPTVRAFMEPRFGQDFGDVRLHTDHESHQLATRIQARAFTYRNDIYLRRGESEHDHRLMAHELTHVVQQRGGAATAQRAISSELDQIESYLSYGVFDWAITDKEAVQALTLLKTLPRFQQAVFFADAKYAGRLRDNLPDHRVPELDALAAGVAGLPAPAPTVAEIQDRLSYGLFDWAITDKDAVEALEMLKQLSGVQLATALAAIDLGRLRDNLPQGRRQELADLEDIGLGLGGTRQTEEEEHPGALIRSIAFRSDHGVMKDNTEDWANSGPFYGEPEWFISNGDVVSHAISQNRNTNISVQLGLNVQPVNAPAAPMRLTGRSSEAALNFDFSGTMQGGLGQTVSMTSSGKLPDTITALENKQIVWELEWRNWKREVGRTRHTVFVTTAAPLAPGEVTYKRMRTAVRLTGEVARRIGSVDPHPLVRGVMERWGAYNLDVVLGNNPGDEWKLADNLDVGAQCIDIVRFVNSLLRTVGVPGTSTAIVVWAKPTSPDTPEPSIWPHGGLGRWPHEPAHPDWFAALMDANDCPNNYEAALQFDHNGTLRFYPGGVPMDKEYKTPLDVLHVFQALVWLTPVARKTFRIQQVLRTYPGGTTPSGEVTCS